VTRQRPSMHLIEELAVIWAQAALMSDRVFGSSFTSSPRRLDEAISRAPLLMERVLKEAIWVSLRQESVMSEVSVFRLDANENTPIRARSECPKCGTPMYVARIVPDESGLDRRSFECPRCQHVETTVLTF
jgi:hypothetical protein